jgi:hypothetical protein
MATATLMLLTMYLANAKTRNRYDARQVTTQRMARQIAPETDLLSVLCSVLCAVCCALEADTGIGQFTPPSPAAPAATAGAPAADAPPAADRSGLELRIRELEKRVAKLENMLSS